MKRNLINAALLGLLVVAAPASTFVSCKDYDDDFKKVNNDLAQTKQDLTNAKTELTTEITSLKGQLTTVNTKLTDLETKIQGLQTKDAELEAAIKNLQTLSASSAALAARIVALETAKTQLQTLIDGKVDQSVYDAKVQEIAGTIAALTTRVTALEASSSTFAAEVAGLKTKAAAQETALKAYEARIKALENAGVSADVQAAIAKIKQLDVAKVQTAVAAVDQLKADIAKLQTEAQVKALIDAKLTPLAAQIKAIEARLNLLVTGNVTSFSLIPDSYYGGIEAIESNQYGFYKWTVNNLNNDGIVDYQSTPSQTFAPANHIDLDPVSTASYHVNPSYANVDTNVKNFTFRTLVRAVKAAGDNVSIKVKNATVDKGILSLDLGLTGDYGKIIRRADLVTGDVTVSGSVVVAALQYSTGADSTVTSDYAAFYENHYGDLHLFNIPAQQIAATTAPTAQNLIVRHNGSLNIAQQVRTVNGSVPATAVAVDANAADTTSSLYKAGFHYEYRLVKQGASDKSYETFTLDSKTGVIKPKFDSAHPYANVGKTAVVRVTLVHGKKDVATLGFFKVKVSTPFTSIYTYDVNDKFEYSCNPLVGQIGFDFSSHSILDKAIEDSTGINPSQLWIDYEYEVDPLTNELVQYKADNAGNAVIVSPSIGVVTHIPSNPNTGLHWELQRSQVAPILAADGEVVTYIKIWNKHNHDVCFYVKLNWKPSEIQKAPAITFKGDRIENNWFDNRVVAGEKYIRMHVSIDGANTFSHSVLEDFVGGTVTTSPLGPGYSPAVAATLSSRWEFVEPRVKDVKGTNGRTYRLSVTADGRDLKAQMLDANGHVTGNLTAIAQMNPNGTITYLNNYVSKVLLNIADHKELNDGETLTARAAYVSRVCGEKIKTTGENHEFDVKFLRPLTISYSKDITFEDAITSAQEQEIDLNATFVDWRDQKGNQLKSIYGVTTFGVAPTTQWTTDLNGGNIETQKLIATFGSLRGLGIYDQPSGPGTPVTIGDFAGYKSYNVSNPLPKLTYTTQSQAFKTYHVRIPVYIGYVWGEMKSYVTVEIKGTINNTGATRRK